MTVYRKILAFLAFLVLSVAGVAVVSTPAQAAGGCNNNAICFYNTASDANPTHERDGADAYNGQCFNLPAGAQNNTSYIINDNGWKWYVYTDYSCVGFSYGTIYAHSAGGMTSPWNNSLSSYKRVG